MATGGSPDEYQLRIFDAAAEKPSGDQTAGVVARVRVVLASEDVGATHIQAARRGWKGLQRVRGARPPLAP